MSEVASIRQSMDQLDALARVGLQVRPERCARVRNRHASCRRCADACTSGALSFAGGELHVERGLCVGCGTCATVCPTCALEAWAPNDGELLAVARRVRSGNRVVFACSEALAGVRGAAASAQVVELACLSRMEESVAASLFADGVRDIVLVHGDCATCARTTGWESACLVKRTVEALVEAWGLQASYALSSTFPVDVSSAENVRAVHSSCAVESADASDSVVAPAEAALAEVAAVAISAAPAPAADSAASTSAVRGERPVRRVMLDGTLPHFVPTRRVRLLDSLMSMGEPASSVVDTRLWGHVVIDEARCRACRMCTVFCPTGALSSCETPTGGIVIEHYALECVHCKLCQDICPGRAISCGTDVPASLLAQGETRRTEVPAPSWRPGPDQILGRMKLQIHSREVTLSYAAP